MLEYVRAPDVAQAVAALAQAGDGGRPLAGGTDLIPQLREGRRRARLLVDVKMVPECRQLAVEDGHLVIGAAVPLADVAADPAVRARHLMLAEAAGLVGSWAIQNRASLGGNLGNAAPSADTVPALICLGAEAEVAGPGGSRRLPVAALPAGPGRLNLLPGEFVVRFFIPDAAGAGAYLRFTPRAEMDIAVAGAGVLVSLGPDGVCQSARVALSAVAPVPLLVPDAAAALVGTRLSDADLGQAAALAQAACRPITDQRAAADYRRHLVGVLVRRAGQLARQRAREGRAQS